MEKLFLNPKALLGGILTTNERFEIVQLSLLKGNTVPTYQFNGDIVMFVAKGSIQINNEIAKENECLLFKENEPHALEAMTDTQIWVVKIKKSS